MRNTIICGDALEVLQALPDEFVDCCVTSPPYWGLRDYGTDGQLGLEPTLQEYIDKIVVVFREVRRVLKDEGTLWLNMGDCYQSGNRGGISSDFINAPNRLPQAGLKDKDLVGMPWRVAFALQADGWYLRSDIIWAKPNPMPESVTDRPTKSHEYIFLLTKKAKYFYDADAVREESGNNTHSKGKKLDPPIDNAGIGHKEWHKYTSEILPYRNKRTIWTIATQPFPAKDFGEHFATFPEKLIEPCIRAGTSEKGYCAECGKPWVRVIEKVDTGKKQKMPDGMATYSGGHGSIHRDGAEKGKSDVPVTLNVTAGWQPSCSCGADTVPGLVFDPFMGSGTAALVAKKLCRDYLGIELNLEYVEMAERRIREAMPLFVGDKSV